MKDEMTDEPMSDEQELSPELHAAAQDYHAPPALTAELRERMWARIAAERAADRSAEGAAEAAVVPIERKRRAAPRWLPWSAGIAALLAAGIGIGRVWEQSRAGEVGGGVPDVIAVHPDSAGRGAAAGGLSPAYRLTVAQHLSQSETFLTLFRAAVRREGGPNERLAGSAAEQLLASNRLLLDSPAGDDPRVRRLLEDLELVLAQISQLPAAGTRDEADRRLELDIIDEGLNQSDVLLRLRTAVPAGGRETFVQGES
jgi:hypothetical protein